jgi:tripartite ATP-independent transporter DctP family solute receptor
MPNFFRFMAAAALALGLSGADAGAAGPADYAHLPEMTIKVAHMSVAISPDNPYQMPAEFIKAYLEEKTGGRLKVEVFHSGQLGRDRELIEAVQYGTVDLAIITTSPISNFVPAHTVLDFPFLFQDWDHVERFLASPAIEQFKAESGKARFHTLAVIPRGFRSVFNNKLPIKAPEDLASVKLRVIESPIFVDSFNALGASAQAMSWGDVFTALQQGTIDGHENTLLASFDERVYEVQKYLSLTKHIFAFCVLVASPPLYDKLPAEYRDLILEATAEFLPTVSSRQRIIEDSFIGQLAEKGMTVNEIESFEPFREKMMSVWDKYNANPEIKKYFDAIEALR